MHTQSSQYSPVDSRVYCPLLSPPHSWDAVASLGPDPAPGQHCTARVSAAAPRRCLGGGSTDGPPAHRTGRSTPPIHGGCWSLSPRLGDTRRQATGVVRGVPARVQLCTGQHVLQNADGHICPGANQLTALGKVRRLLRTLPKFVIFNSIHKN